METTNKPEKTGQTVYMVIGVEGTGSGSLTYPESFDIVGVYFDFDLAQKDADERNAAAGFEYDEDGEQVQDDDLSDEREYTVKSLDVLTRKK